MHCSEHTIEQARILDCRECRTRWGTSAAPSRHGWSWCFGWCQWYSVVPVVTGTYETLVRPRSGHLSISRAHLSLWHLHHLTFRSPSGSLHSASSSIVFLSGCETDSFPPPVRCLAVFLGFHVFFTFLSLDGEQRLESSLRLHRPPCLQFPLWNLEPATTNLPVGHALSRYHTIPYLHLHHHTFLFPLRGGTSPRPGHLTTSEACRYDSLQSRLPFCSAALHLQLLCARPPSRFPIPGAAASHLDDTPSSSAIQQ